MKSNVNISKKRLLDATNYSKVIKKDLLNNSSYIHNSRFEYSFVRSNDFVSEVKFAHHVLCVESLRFGESPYGRWH